MRLKLLLFVFVFCCSRNIFIETSDTETTKKRKKVTFGGVSVTDGVERTFLGDVTGKLKGCLKNKDDVGEKSNEVDGITAGFKKFTLRLPQHVMDRERERERRK